MLRRYVGFTATGSMAAAVKAPRILSRGDAGEFAAIFRVACGVAVEGAAMRIAAWRSAGGAVCLACAESIVLAVLSAADLR
jgi:hypothetical protein